jgi:hypothetical protein
MLLLVLSFVVPQPVKQAQVRAAVEEVVVAVVEVAAEVQMIAIIEDFVDLFIKELIG